MLVPAAATRAAQSKNQAECAVAFMRSPIVTSVEIGCAFVREYCLWLLVYSGFTVTLEHFRVDVILEGVPSGAEALSFHLADVGAKAPTHKPTNR